MCDCLLHPTCNLTNLAALAAAARRTRLIENEVRVLRDESNRLTHEKAGLAERVKENHEKIKLNNQLPYLVSNIVEVLEGVQPGDKIVADGLNKVQPGQPVRVTGAYSAKPSEGAPHGPGGGGPHGGPNGGPYAGPHGGGAGRPPGRPGGAAPAA